MNSLDTNLLIYAVNQACDEHDRSKAVYEKMLESPTQWIISDQVLFEFYRGLRHPKILERPLSHEAALRQISFLREETGVLHCAYETSFWDFLINGEDWRLTKGSHIFDRVLGITLLKNGVKTFYTRNTKDFETFRFENLVNPIDE